MRNLVSARRRAERINHVWCWDFVKDQTADGRTLKFLVIQDEFTRECLALEVDRRIFLEAASYLLPLRKRLKSTIE